MPYIDTLNRKKLFIDFDSTIFDSEQRICDLYNEDYAYYPEFADAYPSELKRYDFSDVCPLAPYEVLKSYFSSQRFFADDAARYWMTCRERDSFTAPEYLRIFSSWYHVVVVSVGTPANLQLKQKFLKEHLPFADFIGADINSGRDKSEIDMAGGVFVDDSYEMLDTGNAGHKIHYGACHPWEDEDEYPAEPAIRCATWRDLYNHLAEGQECV